MPSLTLLFSLWALTALGRLVGVPDRPPGLADRRQQESAVLQLRRVATLGELDDSMSLLIPWDAYVAEVPWGGWVVTEDGNPVILYRSDGRFIGRLGRRGEGPGELRHPNAVAVDPTDSTWISDSRGRAIIFGPDGLPARTLITPDILQIEGFTEKGLPFAMLAKVDRRPDGFSAWRYVQIWSRTGEPIRQLGPGTFIKGATGTPYNEAPQFQGTVVGDTLAVVPGTWEYWLKLWTESGEQEVGRVEDIWRALRLTERPRSWADGGPKAVSKDGRGGYWILGVVRRLSEREEAALIRDTPPPRGESAEMYKRHSPRVSNAVFDGVVVHLEADGTVLGGAVLDDYPRGFSGPHQFYTCTETEEGLIQIHIWEIRG